MPNAEALLTTAGLYTHPMRRHPALALVLLLSGCAFVSVDLTPRIEPLQEQTVEGHGRAKILLLDVSGFLSDEGGAPSLVIGAPASPRVPLLVRVREELRKAAADPDVRALVVRIDSAGGTVTASDVIYRELTLFKRETGRPVVAVMLDVAASGGYYVALAADTIIAHPTSVTGSIGVLMVTLSAEGLLQKLGLATTTIKSAERKDMGSPLRTLTAEERKIFQSVIDGLYEQFVEKLAESRKLGLETARKVADGRIYTAAQALGLKLIDRIGYMPDAIEAARRAIGVEEARVVVYRRPREYRATYYARSEASPAAVEGSLARLGAMLGAGPRFLYFWWP
jgi:protease-4